MSGPAVDVHDAFRVHASADGATVALRGLTVTVDAGEVVAVVGPSGSGKSTLLGLLAGLDAPTAGTVHVLGAEPARLGGRAAAAWRSRSLGLIDQFHARALPPDLSCVDGVALTLRLAGVDGPAARRRALALLERVGLADRADDRPLVLSGGERQRVAVCAALAHRPPLVLADEPAGELDAASAATVHALLAELAREAGTTVVMVTHDPSAAAVADRVMALRDGRLAEESRGGGGPAEAVVGRGGWVRLPEELLARVGIGDRARIEALAGGLVVRPVEEPGRAVEVGAPTTRAAVRAVVGGTAVAVLRGVHKTYGRGRAARTVAADLDATFAAGTVTALSGRSGSGKSTVLRMLAGLERPSAGHVEVNGRDVGALDRSGLADLRRAGIGWVDQDLGLAGVLSATENVALALALRGVARRVATERARRELSLLGLEDRLDARVDGLSGGERQRVAMARALAVDPVLLLADEPTARLDRANAAAVAARLVAVARAGAAVVFATHDAELAALADREIVLAGRPTTASFAPHGPATAATPPAGAAVDVRSPPRLGESVTRMERAG